MIIFVIILPVLAPSARMVYLGEEGEPAIPALKCHENTKAQNPTKNLVRILGFCAFVAGFGH